MKVTLGLLVVILAIVAPEVTMAQNKTATALAVIPNVGHTHTVNGIAFSPSGRWLVSAGSFQDQIKIWDTATGRLLKTIGVANRIAFDSVAISPNGRLIVAAASKQLVVYDVVSGKVIRERTLNSHSHGVSFFPTGNRLAFGLGAVVAVEDTNGEGFLDGNSGTISSIALSPNGLRLAAASSDNTIKVWDTSTRQVLFNFEGHSGWVYSLAFSPDSRWLISGSRDKTVKLWELATGRLLRTVSGHSDRVTSVVIAPNGHWFASASDDRTIRIWDVASGTLLRTLDHDAKISSIAVSPEGQQIASGDLNGTIKLWNPSNGRLLKTIEGHEGVNSLSISPDGNAFAASTSNSATTWWDIRSGQLLQIFSGHLGAQYVSVSPMGDKLASKSMSDKTIKLWDIASGRMLKTINFYGTFGEAVFSRDGRWLLDRNNTTIQLWDTTTGTSLHTFEYKSGRKGWISFALAPDSSRLLTRFYDEKILNVWDTSTGRLIKNIEDAAGRYSKIVFSPDGRRFAETNQYRTVKIWDVERGLLLKTLIHSLDEPVDGVRFSVDGQLLASTGPNTGRVWNSLTGQLLFTLKGERGVIGFSPDGRWLASYPNHANIVNIWNVASGQIAFTINQSHGYQGNFAFTPNSQRIIFGSSNGTIVIYQVNGGVKLATLFVDKYGEWVAISPEGFFVASQKGAGLIHLVHGFDAIGIDQFYQSLYRPDLVREKLAGDPRGLVRDAAARLDLEKLLASGNAPTVAMLLPRDGEHAIGGQINADVELTARDGGIGRIEWRVNGVVIGVEAAPVIPAAGQSMRQTRRLSLDEGDNEIEIVAYNRANLIASVSARVTVTGPASASPIPARLFVLAIGLNDYADEKFKLKYALLDAKALVQALQKTGKGLYKATEVTLLSDADVKRDKLDATFTDLASKIRPSDVFVFFVAGHGKTVDGRYYFVPQDFKFDSNRSSKAALDKAVVAQGIAQEQWQAWFARISAKKSILLFDTCEAGTLTGEGRETQALERGAASDRLVQATGRTILTASAGDNDALEGFRDHGLFTYSVLEALERADGNGDGRIDVAELATYVHAQVTTLSEKVFKQRQVPQVRITTNYPLAMPARVLPEAAPEIVIADKPTHQVLSEAELLVLPALGARRVRKLDAKTPLMLVRVEGGWTLVARQGRPIGYVATRDLSPIQ